MPFQLAPITLPGIQQSVRRDLDLVLDELRRIIAADFPIIGEVNEHLLRMKGKMFRPTLVLLSAQATGVVGAREVCLAAVVELIHLATLVHDDSVDHSVLRRGPPTSNPLFSRPLARFIGGYPSAPAGVERGRQNENAPP